MKGGKDVESTSFISTSHARASGDGFRGKRSNDFPPNVHLASGAIEVACREVLRVIRGDERRASGSRVPFP